MLKDKEKYNVYMREYMLKRYHERRAESLRILGGKCIQCGVTEELEIDHIDPKTKTFETGKVWSFSKERWLKELEKCQLLCKKHHKEKTILQTSVPHGGGLTGKKSCYCPLCGPLKSKYNVKWKKTRRNSSNGSSTRLLPEGL